MKRPSITSSRLLLFAGGCLTCQTRFRDEPDRLTTEWVEDDMFKHENDLIIDECLISFNEKYSLCFEKDGNLHLYKDEEEIWSKTIWDSTRDAEPKRFFLDKVDGQLAAQDSKQEAYWFTRPSPGDIGAPFKAVLGDDGSFVVTTSNDEVLWDAESTGKHSHCTNLS
jgi:hypothetical protein